MTFLLREFPQTYIALHTILLILNSNHSSVLLTLNDYPLILQEVPKLFNATTNRYKFNYFVDQEIELNIRLKSTDDVNNTVNNLINVFQSSVWSSNTVLNQYSTNANPLPENI